MEIVRTILFTDAGSEINNWALFAFRILLSVELFRVHGLKKLRGSNGVPENVPNPFRLPQKLNNLVATFSDTIVPVFVILGAGTRLFLLPTIGVTSVGYFVVHKKDPIEIRDIPYTYTVCLLFLLVVGAGKLSVDHYLYSMLSNN
jgi:putative oxidoreductase